MSNRCEVCGKDRANGNIVSHSNIKSHRLWKPNLHSVKALVDGAPRRVRVCTRCLRSGKVVRAV